MKDKIKKIICQFCGKDIILTGRGKWREDIQAYEWYEGGCDCQKQKDLINSSAKQLGHLGGLMTAKKYGVKHFSEAGKKGMAKRWGNKLLIKKEI